jgi:serine/threonine protein kinase
MSAKLIVITGPDQGKVFTLRAGQTFQIGRSGATATRLSDPAVSRVHCEIEVSGEQPTLHNISAGGTLVNGKAISEHQLQPGDVIRIGATELRYEVEEAVAARDLSALLGERLEEYQIASIIARGTNGVVFKAADLVHDERPIALKIFPPSFADNAEDVERFIRAMKTMIPIRHPHLIAIHGAGKTGPYCWIAMEYFEGDNLAHLVQQEGKPTPFDWKDAFRVAVHIARALEYALEISIVHRSVNPANILFRSRDRIAKLGDLMLAKALEGKMMAQITRPGRVLGDLAYLAPEATHGIVDMTHQADLYGLGASLYLLLTGRPPFVGKDVADLITKIRTDPPDSPAIYQPGLPDTLVEMVLKLLAKKPDQRHGTAKQLLAELEQFGRDVGVSAYF